MELRIRSSVAPVVVVSHQLMLSSFPSSLPLKVNSLIHFTLIILELHRFLLLLLRLLFFGCAYYNFRVSDVFVVVYFHW